MWSVRKMDGFGVSTWISNSTCVEWSGTSLSDAPEVKSLNMEQLATMSYILHYSNYVRCFKRCCLVVIWFHKCFHSCKILLFSLIPSLVPF